LIHKGGDRKDIDNYRGIAIASNVGKLFTRIIHNRLYEVAEREGWLGEMQQGFRVGRSTKDNILVLGHLAEQARRKKEGLFVVFVDFQKAYDRVWRPGLWEVLRGRGVGGKTLRVIQGLYEGHRRKVTTAWGDTDWIECNRGLKQGCVLLPLLFALFIAELEERLVSGGEGPMCGGVRIPGLFFADDLGVMAESVEGITKQLMIIDQFVKERRLVINGKKSAVLEMGNTGEELMPKGWKLPGGR